MRPPQVWAYLWGIESNYNVFHNIYEVLFEPTYEELKVYATGVMPHNYIVWAYLWGIERLPFATHIEDLLKFEPTYEELKV